jgi:hypothetical protein
MEEARAKARIGVGFLGRQLPRSRFTRFHPISPNPDPTPKLDTHLKMKQPKPQSHSPPFNHVVWPLGDSTCNPHLQTKQMVHYKRFETPWSQPRRVTVRRSRTLWSSIVVHQLVMRFMFSPSLLAVSLVFLSSISHREDTKKMIIIE